MKDQCGRALYRNPGYPPGCRLRDIDGLTVPENEWTVDEEIITGFDETAWIDIPGFLLAPRTQRSKERQE
jgi:hypothetical protein